MSLPPGETEATGQVEWAGRTYRVIELPLSGPDSDVMVCYAIHHDGADADGASLVSMTIQRDAVFSPVLVSVGGEMDDRWFEMDAKEGGSHVFAMQHCVWQYAMLHPWFWRLDPTDASVVYADPTYFRMHRWS